MLPLYDHINLIIEIPIFKKTLRGGTLVDKITKKIKEPQSGETLGNYSHHLIT